MFNIYVDLIQFLAFSSYFFLSLNLNNSTVSLVSNSTVSLEKKLNEKSESLDAQDFYSKLEKKQVGKWFYLIEFRAISTDS